ncbi:carboxypeptidase regulatory-like domain-containing protein [uncultured Fibrobacter sp.]|uniref:carboxypeptidase regulatory-like domain-containing protein n=1 Tax=uncultured Fibrobacter sp. TaxID=261512 RepID=UPI0025FC452A|nr:carboxypeptidase regulatory-like domain-containing protein [uncultured Fibrobacter sp.]
MKNLKFAFLTLAATVAFAFTACSNDKTAGTVTDTGNTVAEADVVAGVVRRVDGSPASEAVVRMARMAVFDSVLHVPEQIEVVTDSDGVYAFDSVIADTFQLAVIDTSAVEVFFLPRTTLKAKAFDSIQLAKAAVVNSVLYFEEVEDSAVSVGGHFVTCLSGTPFCNDVFAADSFYMLVPAGNWELEIFPGDSLMVARMRSLGFADSLIYRSLSLNRMYEGDTVSPGPVVWSMTAKADTLIKESEKETKNVARISGTVLCKNGDPCANVEVMTIRDIYGFEFVEGDSLEFVAQTTTDSLGRWWLPVPDSLPGDSFRFEFRRVQDEKVAQVGISRYLTKKEIEGLTDTLNIGKTSLTKASSLVSGVSLVVDREDTTQSNNCMVNSVVVGIKGTSHFVRDVTCYMLMLDGLPSGDQQLVLYSGDPKVMNKLRKSEVPMLFYVTFTAVTLPEGGVQQQQWMTYTPPSQNIFK